MVTGAINTRNKQELPFTVVYRANPGVFSVVPEGVVLCIVLSDETLDAFMSSFSFLKKAGFRFMISFEADNRFDEAMKLLLHAVFCLNYFTEGGVPVIDVSAATNRANEISSRLQKQGFHLFNKWSAIDQGISAGETARTGFPGNADPREWLQNVLAANFSLLSGYVIVSGDDTGVSNNIYNALKDAWGERMVADALYAETVAGYVTARKQLAVFSAENNKLRRQLKGTETTIGVIRTKYKDDYENLFAWYHNEYEILPLWYKRFGHVLKVIMGKRTFRSLFSDDVKKYKT